MRKLSLYIIEILMDNDSNFNEALKIIEYRKEKGKFKLIEDIKQVNGIGENKFNKIKELITV